jgi:hypothetical protein
MAVQNGKVFDRFEKFRRLFKSSLEPFCQTGPVFGVGGHVFSPELDEGFETQDAAKRIFADTWVHKGIPITTDFR